MLTRQHKKQVRAKVYDRDNGSCFWCEKFVPLSEATMDHIIPKSKKGTFRPDNLVLACEPCNFARQDINAEKWLIERAMGPRPTGLTLFQKRYPEAITEIVVAHAIP